MVSSRGVLEVSLAAHPRPGLWGVMVLPDSEFGTLPVGTALLEDDAELYRCVAGFIFIRSEGWSTARHMLLAQALRESPRPGLVANPDISAPYPDERHSAESGHNPRRGGRTRGPAATGWSPDLDGFREDVSNSALDISVGSGNDSPRRL